MDGDKIKYVHLPFCSIFRYEIRVTPRGRELSRGSSIFFFCSHSRVSHRSCKYSLGKTRFAVANRVQAFTKRVPKTKITEITANQHGATPSAARACRSVLGRSPHEGQMPPSRPASIHSGPGHPNGRVCGLTCIPGARPMPLLVLCGWSDVRSEAANPPYKIPGR